MATQISINALNNPQNLITGSGLTNFVVLAQTVRDFVIDPNFGSLLSQAGTGSIPAAAVRPLPGNKIQTAVLSGSNFTGGQIARRSITEQDIADNGIVSRNISNNAVTNEKINNVDGGKIASGTVAADRIANLDATKTTSGVFDAARIPDLDSSKITGGTLDTTRIPNLDASKITSGTLPVERGGTGQTSIAGIRTALSVDRISNNTGNTGISINGSVSTSGDLTISNGTLTSINANITTLLSVQRSKTKQAIEFRQNASFNSGIVSIDLSQASVFVVNKNAAITGWAFTNVPVDGEVCVFILQLVAAGNTAITWPAGTRWPAGINPFLSTTAGKVDTFGFLTHDGGSNWYGFILSQNA